MERGCMASAYVIQCHQNYLGLQSPVPRREVHSSAAAVPDFLPWALQHCKLLQLKLPATNFPNSILYPARFPSFSSTHGETFYNFPTLVATESLQMFCLYIYSCLTHILLFLGQQFLPVWLDLFLSWCSVT